MFWNALAVTEWGAASLPVLVLAGLAWPISILKRAPFLAVATAGLVHRYGQLRLLEWRAALGVGLAMVVALASLPAMVVNPGDITFSALGKNAAIAIKAVYSANPAANIYVSPKLYRVAVKYVEAG